MLRLANLSGSFQDVYKFCKCIQAMASASMEQEEQVQGQEEFGKKAQTGGIPY